MAHHLAWGAQRRHAHFHGSDGGVLIVVIVYERKKVAAGIVDFVREMGKLALGHVGLVGCLVAAVLVAGLVYWAGSSIQSSWEAATVPELLRTIVVLLVVLIVVLWVRRAERH